MPAGGQLPLGQPLPSTTVPRVVRSARLPAHVSAPWHPWRLANRGQRTGLLEIQAHPADQSLVIQVEDDRLGYVRYRFPVSVVWRPMPVLTV
jgi:hypothetical protein